MNRLKICRTRSDLQAEVSLPSIDDSIAIPLSEESEFLHAFDRLNTHPSDKRDLSQPNHFMPSDPEMAQQHKVVALISGGKDSLFSIQHCIANGHEVIALANLHPVLLDRSEDIPEGNIDTRSEEARSERCSEQDDINSYMYQTVGHSIIPLYSKCLDLPLYRQVIIGTVQKTSVAYLRPEDAASQDETESLIPLLSKVKEEHPDITAVSAGAILSSYQRTRVESVALRLGLTPLAYLWQFPYLPPYTPTSLLEDMAATGLVASIVKVASGGLDERFLNMIVSEQDGIDKISKAVARFQGAAGGVGEDDGAVLGEGGEYETMVLDGPAPLWKERIAVGEGHWSAPVVGSGGTAYVKFVKAYTRAKDDWNVGGGAKVRMPALFDEEFRLVKIALSELEQRGEDSDITFEHPTEGDTEIPRKPLQRAVIDTKDNLYVFNLTDPNASSNGSVCAQLENVLRDLSDLLKTHELLPSQVTLVHIILRSMDEFSTVNNIYAAFFAEPNPPARVTIAVGNLLYPCTAVVLSVIITKHPLEQRQALHVQSHSYWAPANIGPYSQAVASPFRPPRDPRGFLHIIQSGGAAEAQNKQSDHEIGPEGEPRILYMAGQIPLIPASMSLLSGDFQEQALLALQHLWRVGRAVGASWWFGGAVAFFTAPDDDAILQRTRAIVDVWQKSTQLCGNNQDSEEEEGDVDIDIAELQLRARPWEIGPRVPQPGSKRKTKRQALPDWSRIYPGTHDLSEKLSACPPVFAIQVSELPRSADVEWTSVGMLLDPKAREPKIQINRTNDKSAQTLIMNEFQTSTQIIFDRIRDAYDLGRIKQQAKSMEQMGWGRPVVEAYMAHGGIDGTVVDSLVSAMGAMIVPCHAVWVAGLRSGDSKITEVPIAVRCRYDRA